MMSKKRNQVVETVDWWRVAKTLTLALAAMLEVTTVQAQSPFNAFDYTRTTRFGYEPSTGRLSKTTQEPNDLALCVETSIGYDIYGNASTQDVANCAGATGRSKFITRRTTTWFDAIASQSILVNGSPVNVSVPAGTAATRVDNALSQSVITQVDPRFGSTIRVQDSNGAVVRTELDDFGRSVRTIGADGTSVVTQYCILLSSGADTSSNSNGCPNVVGAEVPPDARSFTHVEPHNTSDSKSGPFLRTYRDAQGRTIRVVTEGFDGPNQVTGRAGALVVTDTVFNQNGLAVLQTDAYFLASGSSNTGGSADVSVSRTDYDDLGRASAVYAANPTGTKSANFGDGGAFNYGSYGTRLAALTSFGYSGLATTMTDDSGRRRTLEKSALGLEVRVTDPQGAQVAKLYDAFGQLVQSTDALQNSISISYDLLGRRLLLNDPDKGVTQFCYDALGQLRASQNSKMRGSHATGGACPDTDDATSPAAVANWNTFGYDLLGRMTKQISPSDTYQWVYDMGTGARGHLSQSSTASGVSKAFYYDALGRAVSSRIDIANGPSFASSAAFDAATGRVGSKVYPTGFKVSYIYTPLGYLSGLSADAALNLSPLPAVPGGVAPAPVSIPAGQKLWSAQAVGADGRLERSQIGSGVSISQALDGVGRPTSQVVAAAAGTTLISMSYGWDNLNNLSSRADNIGAGTGAVSEAFVYDELNRLKQYNVVAPTVPNMQRQVAMQYNALGMMLSKTDVGNYRYGSQACGTAHPHAPAGVAGSTLCYDLNGNLISSDQGKYRALLYTEFDKVLTAAGPAGGPVYAWAYDAEGMRIKEQRTQGSASRTLWYLHPDAVGGLGFEREVNGADESKNANRHFLEIGGVSVGVIVSMGGLPSLGVQTAPTALASLAASKLEYWHKDHLGSLIATTDHAGNVTARYAYDPYEKRRYIDGNYDANGNLVVDWANDANKGSGRGFTGHEELDDIGLINMNGRIYDDMAGLFLQGDPMIKDPSNTQAFNRYAYVLNNPLNLADPSGFEEQRPQLPRSETNGQRETWFPPNLMQLVDWVRMHTKPRGGLGAAYQYALEAVTDSKQLGAALAAFGTEGQRLVGVLKLVDKTNGKIVGLVGLEGEDQPVTRRSLRNAFRRATGRGDMLAMQALGANPEMRGPRTLRELIEDISDVDAGPLQPAGLGLAGAAAIGWGTLTGDHALVEEAFSAEPAIDAAEGLGLAMSLALGGPQGQSLRASDFRGVGAKISQKQMRHVAGRPELAARGGGSYLDSVADAQSVLDAFHSGEAAIVGKTKNGFPIVRYEAVTGTNVNIGVGISGQPTNLFIIKGTASPSVVPTSP